MVYTAFLQLGEQAVEAVELLGVHIRARRLTVAEVALRGNRTHQVVAVPARQLGVERNLSRYCFRTLVAEAPKQVRNVGKKAP
jgi:hypothetical protein